MKKLQLVGAAGFAVVVGVVLFMASLDAKPEPAHPLSVDDGLIVIKGSDTLGAKMVPQMAEAYMAAGNKLKFEIAAEGSSTCFTNLLAGTTELGMSSREVNDAERAEFAKAGLKLVEVVAAYDMIAVIVNDANPVNGLTAAQLEGIYTSDINNWKEVGGWHQTISAYTRNTSSGTYKTFQRLAMRDRDYGPETLKMAGSGDIPYEVGRNRAEIGYVGVAYMSAKEVKPVMIDGFLPTPRNVHEYPLTRELYYYYIDGRLSSETESFLNWCTEEKEAAEIVERVGFVSTHMARDARKAAHNSHPLGNDDGFIIIKGSDTLGAKMVPKLAETYREKHGVIFQIGARGSSTGFAALLEEEEVELAMSSREVKAEELKAFAAAKLKLKKVVVAYDLVAIIINEKNPIENLTLKQVEGIYTGDITSWNAIGGKGERIAVYSRNTSSGTYKTFQELAMSRRAYGPDTQKLAGGEIHAAEVAKNPYGIMYVGLAYTNYPGTKVVKIDGILPSPKTVPEYPISRELLIYYVDGRLSAQAAHFLDWIVKHPDAAEIIDAVGFIPMSQPR